MSFVDLFVKNAGAKSSPRDKVVGIDIGSSSIKVVELENREEVVTLTTYGELQLGPYQDEKPVGQIVTLNASTEQQALVDVLRESVVKAKRSILAIPLSASFVTSLTMKASPEADLSALIRLEAKKYIPVPLADVSLDWAELAAEGEVDEAATERDVLLAAIQNDALKRFSTLLQSVDLLAVGTEIECFSAIRAVPTQATENLIVIDIGAGISKMYIIHQGLLQRMHRLPIGGAKITERIAKDKGIDFVAAEILKRTATLSGDDSVVVHKATQQVMQRVVTEFNKVLAEYLDQTGRSIETCRLVGGCAQDPRVAAILSEGMQCAIERATPFEQVAYPAFMEDTLKSIGPVFAPALGAALRFFE